jgi:murein L,D-transpeptidase YcbB/YkuD
VSLATREIQVKLPPGVSPEVRAFYAELVRQRQEADHASGTAIREAAAAALAGDRFLGPLVAGLYEKVPGELLYLGGEGGLQRAKALQAELEALADHAVPLKPYHLEDLKAALAAAEPHFAGLAEVDRARLSDPRFGGLLRETARFTEAPPDNEILRIQDLLKLDQGVANSLEAFRTWFELQQRARLAHLSAVIALDAQLARGVARYLLDFRYLKKARPYDPKRNVRVAVEQNGEAMAAAMLGARARPVEFLHGQWPPNPLYVKTMEGLRFYRGLVESEAVKKLTGAAGLARGAKGDAVVRLKERLQAEGYWDDTPARSGALQTERVGGSGDTRFPRFNDKVFGPETQEAVKAYQRAHQLDESGKIDKDTLSSMNKPMEERFKAVALSLQRWRDSNIPYDQAYYFRVNIPQFELEVWQDGKVARRHRVVTGNTKVEVDEKTRKFGPFNYTKPLDSAIDRVILNPKWHVPERITMDELELELLKDPAYFETHNYDIKIEPDGTEIITQGTGEGNALGRVKFDFPNPYAVYMHDTPQKPFFERTIRAFSHGCMRVHKATDLAHYVLEEVEGMTREEVDKLWENKEKDEDGKEEYVQTPVKLKTPIPVHVEYNTVSVDDQGHVMFFIDIYQLDWAYWQGLIPFRTEVKVDDDEFKRVLAMKEKGGIGRDYYVRVFRRQKAAGLIKGPEVPSVRRTEEP